MKQSGAKRVTRGRVLIVLGVLLLLGAAGLYGYNRWVDHRAGELSEQAAITLVEEIQQQTVEIVELPAEEGAPDAALVKAAELNGAYYMGVLTIPSLEKLLPVQSDWSDAKLRTSPCRYTGSVEGGELVIAGHNYVKHFGGLSGLRLGDSVVFTDLEGNQVFYEVRELYTVEATDIEGMVTSGYDLSLFTCTYGGQARFTVRCTRVEPPTA